MKAGDAILVTGGLRKQFVARDIVFIGKRKDQEGLREGVKK